MRQTISWTIMTCKGFPSVVGGHLKSISFQFSLWHWSSSYVSGQALTFARRVGPLALPCFEVPRHKGSSPNDEHSKQGPSILPFSTIKTCPNSLRAWASNMEISSILENPPCVLAPDNGCLNTLQKLGQGFYIFVSAHWHFFVWWVGADMVITDGKALGQVCHQNSVSSVAPYFGNAPIHGPYLPL